jgi:tRNA uridine 5-carbamoylmethylation protein Kti12
VIVLPQSGATLAHAAHFHFVSLPVATSSHVLRSFVHIVAPPHVLLSRNSSRTHPVPDASLLKIAASLEPPLVSKNYFETPVLTLQCNDAIATNAQIVAEWLQGCWQVIRPRQTLFRSNCPSEV